MFNFFRTLLITGACALTGSAFLPAQPGHYPTTDFASPLQIPLYLAGNFAELRSNHFHGGIDIKTSGVEGLKVIAAADGYVSRIKISAFGYGKALYIRHNNGFTTVYGHLQKYNDEIEDYVFQQHYARKSFEMDLFPSASQFPVKKGDVIAISGNSGGSSAPHLHFEVRETATEIPVNPLLFGFDVKDNLPPQLNRLYLYPIGESSFVEGQTSRKSYGVNGGDGNYRLAHDMTPVAAGKIGLGISLYDVLNDVPNRCGIYELKVFDNEDLIYFKRMEKVPFSDKRYINAIVDYEEHVRRDNWIQRCYILPNDRLKIYPEKNGNGLIDLNDGSLHNVRIEVTDSYGNKSEMKFNLKGSRPESVPSTLKEKPDKRFKCKEANSFESENVLVYLPANILYEDLDFHFSVEDTLPEAIAPLYHIHDLYTPLHSYMALSIKLKEVPPAIRKYCTIASLNKYGRVFPEGGYWKGDYLIVKTRSFGAYTVRVDSIAPRLSGINIGQNSDMSRKWSIMIKAEDNLSGVDKYNAYIDGNWVLTEFDYKNNRLIHRFEPTLSKGKHHFKIEVADNVGNKRVFEADFVR